MNTLVRSLAGIAIGMAVLAGCKSGQNESVAPNPMARHLGDYSVDFTAQTIIGASGVFDRYATKGTASVVQTAPDRTFQIVVKAGTWNETLQAKLNDGNDSTFTVMKATQKVMFGINTFDGKYTGVGKFDRGYLNYSISVNADQVDFKLSQVGTLVGPKTTVK
jgi:hypothetical protein